MYNSFETFIHQLSETNATLDYFTDFEKVKRNVDKIEIKLNQLNYLIGKENLADAVQKLFDENPSVFEVLDVLIAVRKEKKTQTLNDLGEVVRLNSYFTTPEKIVEFIEQTGLASVFRCKNITNLVDYVFGVEVGLDTNARKNRSGTNMGKAISRLFDNAKIPYQAEVNSTDFQDLKSLGVDKKRFDFVIKTANKTYLIETNYYNSSGSKPNEVARAYSELANKINQYPEFEFVWITDGQGWLSSENKLEEAYHSIPNVYNLASIGQFIKQIKDEL